jgi:hypothetical protein
MKPTNWTPDKIKLIKVYLTEGRTEGDIAKAMHLSYSSVEHAIRRYNIQADVIKEEVKYEPQEEIEEETVSPSIKIKKTDIAELSKQLGEQMYNNYKQIKLTEPKVCPIKGTREEVSILTLSDAHIGTYNTVFDGEKGKKIVTYNESIFKDELQVLQDSIIEIHGILSNSYSLKKLVIFVLGDMITNDRIFDFQVWEVEKCVGLQIWDGVSYFTKFFNNLLAVYDTIEVVGVTGNHGRSQILKTSDDEPVENNFEYHLYRIWQKQFEGSKRIKVIVPNTRRYLYNVNGWNHLIEHGDAIRGMAEQAQIKQIKELYINTKFDVFSMGHVHSIKEIEISDKITAKINGAWIEKDNYAFSKFKTYSVPKQWFYGCSKSRPITWSYKLDLRKKKK